MWSLSGSARLPETLGPSPFWGKRRTTVLGSGQGALVLWKYPYVVGRTMQIGMWMLGHARKARFLFFLGGRAGSSKPGPRTYLLIRSHPVFSYSWMTPRKASSFLAVIYLDTSKALHYLEGQAGLSIKLPKFMETPMIVCVRRIL